MSAQATERMELRKELMEARDYCLAAADETTRPHENARARSVYCSEEAQAAAVSFGYTLRHRWLWCAREFDRRISNLLRHEDNQISELQGDVEQYAQAVKGDRLDIERARLESLRSVCKRVLQMRDRGAFAKPEEQQLWRDFEAEVMR